MATFNPDSSGLEVAHYSGLEFARGREDKIFVNGSHRDASSFAEYKPDTLPTYHAVVTAKRKKSKRVPLWGVIVIVFLVLAIAAAIAIPVAMKLAQKPTSDVVSSPGAAGASPTQPSQSSSVAFSSTTASAVSQTGGSPTSAANASATSGLSTTGALTGTGLGFLDPLDGVNQGRLFFQHATGEIRESVNSMTGWSGGTSNDVVVSDNIRTGTPIAATSYYDNGNPIYHVVYVDQHDQLQDMKQIGLTGKWTAGALGSHNFFASSDRNVAVSICYSDDWAKGVTDYAQMDSNGGVRIYYGGKDNLVHEIAIAEGSDNWQELYVFPSTVQYNSGLLCYVPNGYQYLFATTNNNGINQLGYWWHDHDTSHHNTTVSPVGTWVEGPTTACAIKSNSQVHYTDRSFTFYQDPNNNLIGIAPNLTIGATDWGSPFQVANTMAIPGTRITSHSNYFEKGLAPYFRVYFQTSDNTITEFMRNIDGGQWSSDNVPVD